MINEKKGIVHTVGEDLSEIINKHDKIIIDFWAPWCGPCVHLGKVIDRLAEVYGGRIFFGKLNVDTHGEFVQKYEVKQIPTLLFIQKGSTYIHKVVGYRSEDILREKIDRVFFNQ